MEKKINVAELLKDCPKGMELDCTMFIHPVTLNMVVDDSEFPIVIETAKGDFVTLTEYGNYAETEEAKCVIFPKGKTTWEGFVPPCQFKDGDVLYVKADSDWILIYQKVDTGYLYKYVAIRTNINPTDIGHIAICGFAPLCHKEDVSEMRLATKEEKEKLFKAIKDNGYNWNPETKTLEKVEPKFKVGDKIKMKVGTSTIEFKSEKFTIIEIKSDRYIVEEVSGEFSVLPFVAQDYWELVPNKFDISTLVPFESRVLVRNDMSQLWIPAFWGYKRDDGYVTTFGWSKYCVPYECNHHLLGKTDDCDEYKTWE